MPCELGVGDGHLGLAVDVPHLDAEQEPVELRRGQREGSHEIQRVLGRDDEEDRVELPEDRPSPICRLDDFWTIGEHQLIIGDGRCLSVVARLLAGERAQMVMIDPPYGCKIENNVSGNGRVRHQDFVMGAGEVPLPEFGRTLLRPAFESIAAHCEPGAIAFVFMDFHSGCRVRLVPDAVARS